MTHFPDNLREFDRVRLTGLAWSTIPRQRFVDLEGEVATLDREGRDDAMPGLKLWADADDGRVWFLLRDIEELTVLDEGEGDAIQ